MHQLEFFLIIIFSIRYMPKRNVLTTYKPFVPQISAQTHQQSMWTHSTSSECPAVGLHKLPSAYTLTASIPRCLPDAWQLASSTLQELQWSRLMRPISWRPERGLCVRMRESTDGSNHGQLFRCQWAKSPQETRKDFINSIRSEAQERILVCIFLPCSCLPRADYRS